MPAIGLGFVPFVITIASDTQVSAGKDLNGSVPVGVFLPGTLTGVSLTFLGASDVGAGVSGTYVPVKKADGSDYSITVAGGTYVPIDPAALRGIRFLKLKSGSVELANRTLVVATRPSA